MTCINNIFRRGRLAVLFLPALLVGGLLLGGCDNDPVAPHDEIPALSESDVASQAGWVAMAAGIVGPETVEFTAKSGANPYQHTFAGTVSGSIFLDFTSGTPGAPVTPGEADHVNLYTEDQKPLIILVGLTGMEGSVLLGFDIEADIDRTVTPNTAVINGGGTFASGPYEASFTFNDLLVAAGENYPRSGTMGFTSAAFSLTATFNGTNIAIMEMSNGSTYGVNLDDGNVEELDTMLLPE